MAASTTVAHTESDWEPVIGLELHAQLATRSKIFSGASTAYGAAPNTQACAIDLGLPGVLPVLNAEVVRMAALFGLAIGATVAPRSVFARKNYFYPDLPKGYQISQYELPIVHDGHVDIVGDDGETRRITVVRAHLEEDAGKSVHDAVQGMTGVDLNRAGTPLLEIVSAPELRSAAEAVAYMRKVHAIVRYLGICDGNMQEGSFRCDANVSLRRRGDTRLGTRTELKNLNSFRFVERAIRHEIERHADVLDSGRSIVQETRLYDPDRDETRSMRGKEEANDYRYFPDPDLLPVEIDTTWLDALARELPELPDAKKARFAAQYELGAQECETLTASRDLAEFFENTARACDAPRLAANWIVGDLTAALNRAGITLDASPVSASDLGELLRRVEDSTLSGKLAKQVFEAMWRGEGSADAIIAAQGLAQVTDAGAIAALVNEVVDAHPEQVAEYRSGKQKVFGFFVGQVMKRSAGKANPAQVNTLLREKLEA
ncbi:MAG: Asp-tRNA(Asn)/Glu-tRNA(Gln) amidotransferase subunit GatB [Chromatiales bacterium]|nr:Asp-tRNA(Asn)/Glu-tRNA(Gln) amidotransferase subunit GatB [Chromatiales bacterium]